MENWSVLRFFIMILASFANPALSKGKKLNKKIKKTTKNLEISKILDT